MSAAVTRQALLSAEVKCVFLTSPLEEKGGGLEGSRRRRRREGKEQQRQGQGHSCTGKKERGRKKKRNRVKSIATMHACASYTSRVVDLFGSRAIPF